MIETMSPVIKIYPSLYKNSKMKPNTVTNTELKTFSKRKFRISFLRILSLNEFNIDFYLAFFRKGFSFRLKDAN